MSKIAFRFSKTFAVLMFGAMTLSWSEASHAMSSAQIQTGYALQLVGPQTSTPTYHGITFEGVVSAKSDIELDLKIFEKDLEAFNKLKSELESKCLSYHLTNNVPYNEITAVVVYGSTGNKLVSGQEINSSDNSNVSCESYHH